MFQSVWGRERGPCKAQWNCMAECACLPPDKAIVYLSFGISSNMGSGSVDHYTITIPTSLTSPRAFRERNSSSCLHRGTSTRGASGSKRILMLQLLEGHPGNRGTVKTHQHTGRAECWLAINTSLVMERFVAYHCNTHFYPRTALGHNILIIKI